MALEPSMDNKLLGSDLFINLMTEKIFFPPLPCESVLMEKHMKKNDYLLNDVVVASQATKLNDL